MNIKIKKLHNDAVIPQYSTPGAAGFDLHALEDVEIHPGETKLVRTGLAVDVGPGPILRFLISVFAFFRITLGYQKYELQVRPRSGTSLKTPLRVANSPGTVDADYRGEVCVIMQNTATPKKDMSLGITVAPATVRIKKGERIAQGVVSPVMRVTFQEVKELPPTVRGAGGFGSTGK